MEGAIILWPVSPCSYGTVSQGPKESSDVYRRPKGVGWIGDETNFFDMKF